MKAIRLRIRGRWWRIAIKTPPARKCLGLCDYDERTIHIRPSADRLATVIHEVLHAAYPDLDESAVQAGEEAIVNALRSLKLTP